MAIRGGTVPPLILEKKVGRFQIFVGRFCKNLKKLAGFAKFEKKLAGFIIQSDFRMKSWQVGQFLQVGFGKIKKLPLE